MTDEALHLLARVLLRVTSPRRAHRVLRRVGALLPARSTPDDLLGSARRLRVRGTCLTRALAVAARAPDAEVVIGVAPRGREPLFAHAWVELWGRPLDPTDVAGSEIARLRACPPA